MTDDTMSHDDTADDNGDDRLDDGVPEHWKHAQRLADGGQPG